MEQTLFQKILALQAAIKPIAKDSENPFFKSNYFDVNAVVSYLRPLLSKHGLVVLQPLSEINGEPAIETHIIEASTGQQIGFKTPLIKHDDPQKYGSIITYTRRYALVSLFLLEGEEDDDANSVSKVSHETKKENACKDCGKPSGKYTKCYSCNHKKQIVSDDGESFFNGYLVQNGK
jgi:ribosomal protein S14